MTGWWLCVTGHQAMLGRDLGLDESRCQAGAAGSHPGSLSGEGQAGVWGKLPGSQVKGTWKQGDQRQWQLSRGQQGVGGRSRGRVPAPWPAVGPPVPGPWSPLTMDPYHVLQDEDPLCQDLQGLPQLLHPLTLQGGSSQGQGHFASVYMLSQSFPFLPVTSNTTATIHSVLGIAFEFLFTDKEPTHREGNQSPLDAQPGSSLAAFMPRCVPSSLGFSCSKLPASFPCVPFFPENARRAPRTGPQVGELG